MFTELIERLSTALTAARNNFENPDKHYYSTKGFSQISQFDSFALNCCIIMDATFYNIKIKYVFKQMQNNRGQSYSLENL